MTVNRGQGHVTLTCNLYLLATLIVHEVEAAYKLPSCTVGA